MQKLWICFFILFALSACSLNQTNGNSGVAENSSENNVEKVENSEYNNETTKNNSQQDEIKKVDFKNFTYEPFCAAPDDKPEKITVKNGEYTRDKGDDKLYFAVGEVTYGDVNGDKQTDAIITSTCNTGGTGNFSEGFIYELKNDKPVLLARISGGDRAYGGIRSAEVKEGLIFVERNDPGEGGASCCPELAITTKYKLDGSKLVEGGNSQTRELYPKERVSFNKGSSEIEMKIKVDEIRRFVVGAKAGQTLSASVNSKNVSIGLMSDDADISDESTAKLTAILKKNGDYVIQIQNLDEKPIETTLKISIQ